MVMRRSKNEMKIGILQLLAEGDSQQTALSEKLHINPATTTECLRALRKNSLVSKNGWVYSITTKGKDAAKKAKDVAEMMK